MGTRSERDREIRDGLRLVEMTPNQRERHLNELADAATQEQQMEFLSRRSRTELALIIGIAVVILGVAVWQVGWGNDSNPNSNAGADEDLVEVVAATLTSQTTEEVATPIAAIPTPMPSTVTPTPSISQVDEPSAAFSIAWEQTALVAVTRQFIEAYNTGDVEQVLDLLTNDVGWADCDYETGESVILDETEDIEAWLEERVSSNDQLEVARMWNENTNSNSVLAIDWTRRTSDDLRALGYDDGIEPDQATVVSFRREDGEVLIRGFGTVGAPCELPE